MESHTVSRRTVLVLVVLAAVVLFTTACTCCWMPAAVRRAGSFGRAMPWRDWARSSWRQVEASEEISQSFDVSTPLSLQVHISVGNVRIEVDSGDKVQVSGTKYAFGTDRTAAEARLRDLRVEMRQDAPNKIVIESSDALVAESRSPRVDLVIKVPRRTSVQAVVNVGNLRVEEVWGSLDLASSVGEVTAREVALTGNSRLATNVGTVALRLPADTVFELDARSSVGDVVCEFPLQQEQVSGTLVGKTLSGRVGEAPEVTLTLQVNIGDVRVQRGP